MTQDQRAALSRTKAQFAHSDYIGLDAATYSSEDVKTVLSIIDDQDKKLNSFKSDLQDLKAVMIEEGTWEHFEGSMIHSIMKALEE